MRMSDTIRDLELPPRELHELGTKLDWLESVAATLGNSVEQALLTLDMPLGVPSGLIGIFTVNCPSGWTRVSSLDNRFPRGASSYGGTGGSADHSHSGTNSHVHGTSTVADHGHDYTTYNTAGFALLGGGALARRTSVTGGTDSAGSHVHGFASAGAGMSTDDNTPPYVQVVYCRRSG